MTDQFDGMGRQQLLKLAMLQRVERQKRLRADFAQPGGLMRFIEYFWHVLEPVTPFVKGWAVDGMALHLEAVHKGYIKRLLCNVSPGFMKSMLVNVFFPAWEWGPMRRPDLRYVSFSYSSLLTERDNERFLTLVASPEYQELFGDVVQIVKGGVAEVSNSQRGFKKSSSIGGVGTGERGNRVLADDLHKVSEAESETVREYTTRWFRESMQNRLNDLGRDAIIVIGQRVHEADVSGVILDEYPDYVHYCVPMEYDGRDVLDDGSKYQTIIGWEDPREEDGELAWPERYPDEVLEPFRTRSYLWNGQYQQSPTPRGGGILKEEYWKIWDDKAQRANDVKVGTWPQFEFILASFDGAFTEKKENDYSALVVLGVWIETNPETAFDERFGTPRIMLIDAWHKRLTLHGGPVAPKRFDESDEEFKEREKKNWGVVEHIVATCRKHKIDKLILENKASGFSVEQEMKRLFFRENYTVALHDPGRMDKVARAYSVEYLFTDGLIWRPATDWAQMVVDEAAQIPRGAHDDLSDALVNGITHLRKMSLAPRREDSHFAIEQMLYPSRQPRRLNYEG